MNNHENYRNEIKAYIVRAGMTMSEVVEVLADEYGWSSHRVSGVCTGAEMLEREDRRIEGKQEGSAQMDRAFFFPVFIARPENNAKKAVLQSANCKEQI